MEVFSSINNGVSLVRPLRQWALIGPEQVPEQGRNSDLDLIHEAVTTNQSSAIYQLAALPQFST